MGKIIGRSLLDLANVFWNKKTGLQQVQKYEIGYFSGKTFQI